MALDLPLPEQIFGHPWLLMSNDKMSKSKGNVIYADDLVEHFGVDAVRYYLLHEIPFSSDGNITYELLIERINGDLANVLGNLVQRTISMAKKYFNKKVEYKGRKEDLDDELITQINNLRDKIDEKMKTLEVAESISVIFEVLRASNKYIDETTPWILAKEENKKERLETVLYHLLESIRVCAIKLEPFLPSTSQEILRQLNTEDKTEQLNLNNKYELNDPEVLFARIDKETFLA